MLKKTRLFIGALCLAAFLFSAGCDTSTGSGLLLYTKDSTIPLPAALTGKWLSPMGDEYEISAAKFTAGYGGVAGYSGNIVHVRDDGAGGGTGYITFQYTMNTLSYGSPVGSFCVLYWENFSDGIGTADMCVANDGAPGDSGRPTQEEAEAEFTIGDGDDYYYGLDSFTRSP
ncbi:MAG: hypothetical protein LBD71_05240 [Treponema sp.]|jgi:predicted small secreted protein|nr:hypothetical protein [Treponema sp.]